MRILTSRAGAILIALALTASACQQATTPSGASPAATSAAVKLKDTIVIAMSQEPESLNSMTQSMMVASQVLGTLATGLTVRDDKNTPQARIAKEVPSLEKGTAKVAKTADGKDQLTVTWKLRDDVTFTNGDPLTSEDVKYSWEGICLNKAIPITDRSGCEDYQSVDTPDKYTVIVTYKPDVLDPLYFYYCCTIYPKKVVSAIDPAKFKDAFARNPIYAGAYKLKEWAPGSSITVEAYDKFYLGAPKTKTIIFKFITDTNTLLAQLKAKQADIGTSDALQLDQSPELDKLEAESGIKPNYTPAQVWEHVDFNLVDPKDHSKPHPVLGDVKVRQAIAHGINKDEIVKTVLFGKTKPIDSFIFGNSWAAADPKDITVYPFDQNKAKALLDEAGWKPGADGIREKGGVKAELKLQSTTGNKLREQTTQIMANQLKQIGIKVNIELLPASKYFATKGEGPLNNGTFDMGLFAWVQGDDPYSTLYLCKQRPEKENNWSGQNDPRYCNPAFDKVQEAANQKLLQSERKPLLLEAQKIWTKDLPVLPLYQRINIDAAPVTMKNFRPTPTNTPVTWNCWEWELPQG